MQPLLKDVFYLKFFWGCQIWVYGNSYRSMLIAVVAPHEGNAMIWAEKNGYDGSFAQICALDDFRNYILQELRAIAEKNKVLFFFFFFLAKFLEQNANSAFVLVYS
jgi:hypothetical protein